MDVALFFAQALVRLREERRYWSLPIWSQQRCVTG